MRPPAARQAAIRSKASPRPSSSRFTRMRRAWKVRVAGGGRAASRGAARRTRSASSVVVVIASAPGRRRWRGRSGARRAPRRTRRGGRRGPSPASVHEVGCRLARERSMRMSSGPRLEAEAALRVVELGGGDAESSRMPSAFSPPSRSVSRGSRPARGARGRRTRRGAPSRDERLAVPVEAEEAPVGPVARSTAAAWPPVPTVPSTRALPASPRGAPASLREDRTWPASDPILGEEPPVLVGEGLLLEEPLRKPLRFHTARWFCRPRTLTSPAMAALSRSSGGITIRPWRSIVAAWPKKFTRSRKRSFEGASRARRRGGARSRATPPSGRASRSRRSRS